MTRVFGHGGLRLVLLSILEDGPKHGYEVIVALEDRFMGMYRPSSGTVYPRLTALEEEGLVESEEVGDRRVYRLTTAGRRELADRRSELEDTVSSATESVRTAMEQLQREIRTTAATVQAEVGHAATEARRQAGAVADTLAATESAARHAWRAGESTRRAALDEARRVRRLAEDLRRQARHEARAAASDVRRQGAGARSEVEDLVADVAGWATEVVDAFRRRARRPQQGDRLQAAIEAGRRAFTETLRGESDQPSGGAE